MKVKIHHLYTIFKFLHTPEEVENLFKDLLTEHEIKEVSNRWKVAQLLYQKVPYKDIEKETGISSTTIAKISKLLTNRRGGFKKMLEHTM